MAFNKFLAYRSQGVNPSMYSDNRQEAMRMMDEDMAARWDKDRNGFQQAMLRQAQQERQGRLGEAAPEETKKDQPAPQQPAQQPAPHGNAMGGAPIRWPGMHPAHHFGALQNMVASTNQAWANEMDSRREQAEAERSRQHAYEMQSLEQQQNNYQQASQQESAQLENSARQARNRSLLGAAGLGGVTVRSDGRGNTSRSRHPFGRSPFARSLLGD
jgi:hypothetical protein